ncbi:MAG: hypothetical protein SGILL_009346, partial [Bacillariaceae sp.]
QGKIDLTATEEQCLRQTGELFENNNELIAARHNYATAMQTEMTSSLTMTASYPQDKLDSYYNVCSVNRGKVHSIKIDFFDCKLGNMQKDVELTLKNFANCLADTTECVGFDQEKLLEEAWDELGLHCELEEGPGGDVPVVPYTPGSDDAVLLDDDLAHKEEKAAAEGADDVDRTEKASEYIPKEEEGKAKKKKGGAGKFFTNLLILGIIGAAGYVVWDRKYNSRRLPWGGVSTARFQGPVGGPSGFVSDYHMISGEDTVNFAAGEHELQLSNNLTA